MEEKHWKTDTIRVVTLRSQPGEITNRQIAYDLHGQWHQVLIQWTNGKSLFTVVSMGNRVYSSVINYCIPCITSVNLLAHPLIHVQKAEPVGGVGYLVPRYTSKYYLLHSPFIVLLFLATQFSTHYFFRYIIFNHFLINCYWLQWCKYFSDYIIM